MLLLSGKRTLYSATAAIALCLIFIESCKYPYEPTHQSPPMAGSNVVTTSSLYPINPGRQICNPSASQDTVNFKACMLYLNLGGNLPVNVPEDWKSIYTNYADQPHDRLTIIDTSNTVRWFLMKPTFIPQTELQDPEWSANPEYIAFLGDADYTSDGYIVRISDKSILRFNKGNVQANSTPHLWTPHSAVTPAPETGAAASLFSDDDSLFDKTTGMVRKETIGMYFSTDSVKIVFAKDVGSSGLTIHYIDYSQPQPGLIVLPRPKNREGMACESPLISPDGRWIVFNCKNGSLANEAYLQRLDGTSQPLLLHQGTAAEPHWWRNPGNSDLYILYCTAIGPLDRDLIQVPSNGSYGSTLIRRVNLSSGLAWQVLYDNESELCGLPFQGGLTPDGRYLVTGYQYGYIFSIPSL